jgi:hypothetical protein
VETSAIEATIFYRHSPEEVEALSEATVAMADHIRAVGLSWERAKMRAILSSEYFLAGDAAIMRKMLLRAANHARYHLSDYFPLMREEIVANTERLEQEVGAYWTLFQRHNELIPK